MVNTNKGMILNFTGNIGAELRREMDRMAETLRKDYVLFLSKVIQGQEGNIDWWVMDFISRNTAISPMFRNCCVIEVVREYAHRTCLQSIVVDSQALAKAIRQIVRPGTTVCVSTANLTTFCSIKPLLKYVHGVCIHIVQIVASLFTRCLRKPLSGDMLTLLGVFLTDDSIVHGNYRDRYYGSLLSQFSSEELENIYYFPNYYRIRNHFKAYQNMRTAQQNFIIRDDFLQLSDYTFSWGLFWRSLRLKPTYTQFRGVDISGLIREEILCSSTSSSSMAALLNYRLPLRLKQKGIRIKKVVTWFENQTIDHGFNAGIQKHYPFIETVGYIGIPLPNNYLSVYPTDQEIASQVIPSCVSVIGEGFKEMVIQFSKELQVSVAPAFRYESLWRKQFECYTDDAKGILVALPISVVESVEMLKIIAEASALFQSPKPKFYIKPHPTVNPKCLSDLLNDDWPGSFQLVDGSMDAWLMRCLIVISSSSSATIETIARGIPVILLSVGSSLTLLYIPPNVPRDMWNLCYESRTLEKTIRKLLNMSEDERLSYQRKGRCIRKMYFEPVTVDASRNFLSAEVER